MCTYWNNRNCREGGGAPWRWRARELTWAVAQISSRLWVAFVVEPLWSPVLELLGGWKRSLGRELAGAESFSPLPQATTAGWSFHPLGVVFCVAPAQGTAPCWLWRFHVRIPEMNALFWARPGMGNEWFLLDCERCPSFGARACPSSLHECRGRGFFVFGTARGPLHAEFAR